MLPRHADEKKKKKKKREKKKTTRAAGVERCDRMSEIVFHCDINCNCAVYQGKRTDRRNAHKRAT
jgi:acetyl-CoA carboxylase beta subunit